MLWMSEESRSRLVGPRTMLFLKSDGRINMGKAELYSRKHIQVTKRNLIRRLQLPPGPFLLSPHVTSAYCTRTQRRNRLPYHQDSFRKPTERVTRSITLSSKSISATPESVLSSASSLPGCIAVLKRLLASRSGCKKLPATSLSFHMSWISRALCKCFAQRRRYSKLSEER